MITFVLALLLAAPLCAGSVYLLALVLAGLRTSRGRKLDASIVSALRYATVVPAHNEALSIGATLDSILAAEGAPAPEAIYVIADNCTDETALIARAHGVQVWEREAPDHRGKGQALDAFLQTFHRELKSYDLIAFFDADTLVDRRFFSAMTRVFCQQHTLTAAQAYYGVSNPYENWRTQLCHVALRVAHDFRQAARVQLGGNAGLKGNGMVFRRRFLANCGWPAHSVVEDLELGLRLTLTGERIAYEAGALVHGEMATGRDAAQSQRRRWEGGRAQMACKWLPELLRVGFQKKCYRSLEAAADLAFPPLATWVALGLAALIVSFWQPWLGVVGLLAIGLTVLLVAAALWRGDEPRATWFALVKVPLFLAQKVGFALVSLRQRSALTWERTGRNAETTP